MAISDQNLEESKTSDSLVEDSLRDQPHIKLSSELPLLQLSQSSSLETLQKSISLIPLSPNESTSQSSMPPSSDVLEAPPKTFKSTQSEYFWDNIVHSTGINTTIASPNSEKSETGSLTLDSSGEGLLISQEEFDNASLFPQTICDSLYDVYQTLDENVNFYESSKFSGCHSSCLIAVENDIIEEDSNHSCETLEQSDKLPIKSSTNQLELEDQEHSSLSDIEGRDTLPISSNESFEIKEVKQTYLSAKQISETSPTIDNSRELPANNVIFDDDWTSESDQSVNASISPTDEDSPKSLLNILPEENADNSYSISSDTTRVLNSPENFTLQPEPDAIPSLDQVEEARETWETLLKKTDKLVKIKPINSSGTSLLSGEGRMWGVRCRQFHRSVGNKRFTFRNNMQSAQEDLEIKEVKQTYLSAKQTSETSPTIDNSRELPANNVIFDDDWASESDQSANVSISPKDEDSPKSLLNRLPEENADNSYCFSSDTTRVFNSPDNFTRQPEPDAIPYFDQTKDATNVLETLLKVSNKLERVAPINRRGTSRLPRRRPMRSVICRQSHRSFGDNYFTYPNNMQRALQERNLSNVDTKRTIKDISEVELLLLEKLAKQSISFEDCLDSLCQANARNSSFSLDDYSDESSEDISEIEPTTLDNTGTDRINSEIFFKDWSCDQDLVKGLQSMKMLNKRLKNENSEDDAQL